MLYTGMHLGLSRWFLLKIRYLSYIYGLWGRPGFDVGCETLSACRDAESRKSAAKL